MDDTTNKQIKDYLKELLEIFPAYQLTEDDKKLVQRNTAEFILSKLLRKKFRKQKLHPDTIKEFTEKIAARVKNNEPIHFTIPFGGYKHYWNPSHPEPDWAEIFTLRFLTEWVSPIIASYDKGVVIDFISEDMILSRMNNYPEEVLEKYSLSFRAVLDIYKKSLPKNFSINYFRVGDKYDKNKIVSEVEALLPERWKKWAAYTNEEKEMELKRSRRSVMWKGKEDLTSLSDDAKEKKMIESRLIELAYYDTEAKSEYLGDYFTEDNHIPICFSFGLSPDNATHWITLGSTYASTVDYWIGRGILEKGEQGFTPRIVSKEQYQKIKDKLAFVQLELSELPHPNYGTIELISAQDWKTSSQ